MSVYQDKFNSQWRARGKGRRFGENLSLCLTNPNTNCVQGEVCSRTITMTLQGCRKPCQPCNSPQRLRHKYGHPTRAPRILRSLGFDLPYIFKLFTKHEPQSRTLLTGIIFYHGRDWPHRQHLQRRCLRDIGSDDALSDS